MTKPHFIVVTAVVYFHSKAKSLAFWGAPATLFSVICLSWHLFHYLQWVWIKLSRKIRWRRVAVFFLKTTKGKWTNWTEYYPARLLEQYSESALEPLTSLAYSTTTNFSDASTGVASDVPVILHSKMHVSPDPFWNLCQPKLVVNLFQLKFLLRLCSNCTEGYHFLSISS